MKVVVAEKPSVARDIAAVVGAGQHKGGYLEGGGYQVTWAVGHLLEFASPHEIDPAWRRWDPAHLPMFPASLPLVVREGAEDQYRVVARLLTAARTREVVCATDAGREGEHIFRLIYQQTGCTKRVSRLWISSLTPEAIRDGMHSLRPGSEFDALAAAAQARAEADWLVGMNFSRAYTLSTGEMLSVGRVQTPTLAMVVARDAAIAQFEPEPYREVHARFATERGEFEARYMVPAYDERGEPKFVGRLPPSSDDPAQSADLVAQRAKDGEAGVRDVVQRPVVRPPPLLFDLTELQRAANRAWGWSAQRTLTVAQELYEKHKALSYPRTDSRHLSEAVADTLGPIVEVVAKPWLGKLAPETGRARLGRRFVQDAKVTDHHAIIPTRVRPQVAPDSDPGRLHDLVVRRLLSAWQGDAIDLVTEVVVEVAEGPHRDRYEARGKAVDRPGWRVTELPSREMDAELPAGLRKDLRAEVREVRVVEKETRPAPHFTEATLLSAMESAGASLKGELSEAMRDRGLGTPATRAAMIEKLVGRGYVVREGKTLRATELGALNVKSVHPHVASPALTGEWESRLRQVERGEQSAADLLTEVRSFVRTTVECALEGGVKPRAVRPASRGGSRGKGGSRRSGEKRTGKGRARPRTSC